MKIRLMALDAPYAHDEAIDLLHREPVLVQLPQGFALLAAPTGEGVAQLDRCQPRSPGQALGTAIGSLQRFLAQADPARLPAGLRSAADLAGRTGQWIRLPWRPRDAESPVLRAGQHEGLLLGAPYRDLFCRAEHGFELRFLSSAPDPIWHGLAHGAPLCAPCGVDGRPLLAPAEAVAMAEATGLRLVLTAPTVR